MKNNFMLTMTFICVFGGLLLMMNESDNFEYNIVGCLVLVCSLFFAKRCE